MKTSKESLDASLIDDYKIEMNRLKEIQHTVSEVEARPFRQKIDKAASARFIKHGIGRPDKRCVVFAYEKMAK